MSDPSDFKVPFSIQPSTFPLPALYAANARFILLYLQQY